MASLGMWAEVECDDCGTTFYATRTVPKEIEPPFLCPECSTYKEGYEEGLKALGQCKINAKVSWRFTMGDSVRKVKGSQWKGKVVGFYSTELTPEGYAVESDTEIGSVQIYPAAALVAC